MGSEYRKIVRSRKLAERSYLYFQYPNKDKTIEFYLPFMENIEVAESQRPNLASYDLIGRAGSLHAYLGAKSREFMLRFSITLPNIVDYIHTVGLSNMFASNFRELVKGANTIEEREKFFKGRSGVANSKEQKKFDYYTEGKRDMQLLDSTFVDGNDQQAVSFTRSFFDKLTNLFQSNSEYTKGFPDIDMGEAVNFLMTWVNIIRSSVLNNSKKTQYGPPIIYLNHGTMYNNIPCICTNFSININNSYGYELLSLAPRQVQVTMNLTENRVGNFDKFVPFDEVKGDNLTGWEAIIDGPGTLDPHNQFLRLERGKSDFLEVSPFIPKLF